MPARALHRSPAGRWRRLAALAWLAIGLLALPPQPASGAAPGGPPPAAPALPTAPAARVRAAQSGVQAITRAELAAAGLPPGDGAGLRVRRAGVEVPAQLFDATGDSAWDDDADELRFFAPPPGDRWNLADTYWLTSEPGAGLRMAARTLTAQPGAPATAVERRVWRGPAIDASSAPGSPRPDPMVYFSRVAGPDADHWFIAELRFDPPPAAPQHPLRAQLTVPLTSTLTPLPGTTRLDITLVPTLGSSRTLSATIGPATVADSWSGGATTRTIDVPATGPAALLTLGGSQTAWLAIDRVAWERPVSLAAGGQGIEFAGTPAQQAYAIADAPAGATLYDIGDMAAPVALDGADLTGFADSLAGRSYLLAGPGTLHRPGALPFAPPALPAGADTLYIVPAALQGALAPLVALREAQGHSVAIVDPQAIYDGWSHGQVSPAAIREFLRYAAATWSPAPQAVTLVGDGTRDPHDYTRRGPNNVNVIPPYLAPVDAWLGETACETCYAQLDGASPLDDRQPDLWLGRLPVRSAAELQALVAKIVGYETAPGGGLWRSRMLYLADDPDSGGDFHALAAESAALHPVGVTLPRVYFGPGGQTNAALARQTTVDWLNQGAALAVYIGHAHQWQWAVTDIDSNATPKNWLLDMFDATGLQNGERLPVVLSLTCLSSAFHTPAFGEGTVDERLLLNPAGGAVAVWGPTGQNVAFGHDRLQRGFLRSLWATPPGADGERSAPLGALVAAGYAELLGPNGCCQDAVYTYTLLGDPRTSLRVRLASPLHLPLVAAPAAR